MKKVKITFAEGCFDELAEELTQDEIDAIVGEIEDMVESGELFEHSFELTDEEKIEILQQLNSIQKNTRQ